MLRNIKSKFVLGISMVAIGILAVSNLVLAQTNTSAVTTSDPTVTNLWVINSEPVPNDVVDLTIFYGNEGPMIISNVTLTIDYDEANLYSISLGDPSQCSDNGDKVICNFSSLNGNSSYTIGYTARVVPTAQPGTEIDTTAIISAEVNENIQNDFGRIRINVIEGGGGAPGAPGAPGGTVGGVIEFRAPTSPEEPGGAPSPNQGQGIALFNVQNNPNWQTDPLSTAGLKFMIRGKEALAWSLNIEDSGFHSPAIRSSYLKVLTVVNSLFIIGLLAIAAMWMFSIVIPRKYLRQVVLVYGAAVIFVNFALPLNQLFIDGTQLLQKTFLGDVNIASIVETPAYNNPNAIAYQDQTDFLRSSATKKLDFSLAGKDSEDVKDIIIGKIEQNLPYLQGPSYTGTISYRDADGAHEETIELRSTTLNQILRLDTDQSIELTDEKTFNPNQEHSIFAFLMVLFTGFAYFGMALLFIFRIVILWALMIVSPVLFLLAIFRVTRSYFYNWLGIYARWLLIGPFMALGIAIIVNIWKTVGLPITSSYISFGEFGVPSNLGFYLPGKEVINNLNNTSQMMEYMLFLVMLYLPIVFAFMLTRQKLWSAAASTITEKRAAKRAATPPPTIGAPPAEAGAEGAGKPETVVEKAKSLVGGVTGFLGTKFAGVSKSTMPETMTSAPAAPPKVEAAHSFLPEHLALSSMKDVMGLMGVEEGSRQSRGQAIEKLAAPDAIADPRERNNAIAVRSEISERAGKGDGDAVRVLNEIQEKETQLTSAGPAPTAVGGVTEAPTGAKVEVAVSAPEVHVEAPTTGPTVTTKEIMKEKETVIEKGAAAPTHLAPEKKKMDEEKGETEEGAETDEQEDSELEKDKEPSSAEATEASKKTKKKKGRKSRSKKTNNKKKND